MPQKPTVFISYHRASGEQIATTIHDALQARGADIFYDHDVPLGQPWDVVLPDELATRDHHLVILTPPARGSTGVVNEIGYSLTQGKHIIPVMAAGFSFRLPNLPPEIAALSTYMGVNYDENNPTPAIEKLAKALGLAAAQPTAKSTDDERPASQKHGMSDSVKVAIIGGIFALLAAIIGLAPSFIDLFAQSPPTPTGTLSPTIAPSDTHTPTPIPPTETATLTQPPAPTNTPTIALTDSETTAPTYTPTATYTATFAPTITDVPTTLVSATGTYPCEAEIVFNRNALLNEVRAGPSSSASYRPPVQQGATVIILSKVEETRTDFWFQIANSDGEELGWIPTRFVRPSASCAQ